MNNLLVALLLSTAVIAETNTENQRVITPKLEMTFAKIKAVADNGPLPVLYHLDGNRSPSCGLVLNKLSKNLIPVLETDEGSEFPFCVGFLDEAVFEFKSEKYAVFRYQQRDTRPESGKPADDSYNHFIVRYNKEMVIPLDDLNGKESSGDKKSAQAVSAWALRELNKAKPR